MGGVPLDFHDPTSDIFSGKRKLVGAYGTFVAKSGYISSLAGIAPPIFWENDSQKTCIFFVNIYQRKFG